MSNLNYHNIHKVEKIRHLTNDTFVIRLERKEINFTPGQHLVMGIKGDKEFRQYSIYSGVNDPYIELLIKEVGTGVVTPKLKKLKPGDVVIKGANALNYKNKLAAVMIGAPDAGTTGTIIPYITGRKAKLIIPIGLEKEIGDDIIESVKKMQQPYESINDVYNMYLYTGDIITEIEALKILADVSVTHIASGGIGGAEGSVRLLIRGPEKNVRKALDIIKQIQGEPPFVE